MVTPKFVWYLFLSMFFRVVAVTTLPLGYLGCPWPLEAAFYIVIYDELTTKAWDGVA